MKTKFPQLLFERIDKHQQEIFAVKKLVESAHFCTKSTEFFVVLWQTTNKLILLLTLKLLSLSFLDVGSTHLYSSSDLKVFHLNVITDIKHANSEETLLITRVVTLEVARLVWLPDSTQSHTRQTDGQQTMALPAPWRGKASKYAPKTQSPSRATRLIGRR